MGLAASQARLLNLTSRMHDIEYKAQKLEAQKLQMANESTQVYQEYENALNTTKLQLKQINNDGSASYVDATYDLLTQSGYYVSMIGTGLDCNANKMVVAQSDIDTFDKVKSAEKFAAVKSGMCEVNNVGGVDCVTLADTNTICIFTASDLTDAVARSSATKILMNDITINKKLANYLCGTFDGNGHTITVTGSEEVFTHLQNATIKNLNVCMDISAIPKPGSGAGSSVFGGLAAYSVENSENTIENVNLTGSIDIAEGPNDMVGSVVANARSNSTLKIKNVTSYVDITVGDCTTSTRPELPNVGGFVGYSDRSKLTIEDSEYNGAIKTVGGSNIGGLVGNVYTTTTKLTISPELTITNSSTAGSITNTGGDATKEQLYAGGIVGVINNVAGAAFSVTNNESSMNITIDEGKKTVGVGGVIGHSYYSGATTTSNNYTKNVQCSGSANPTYNEIIQSGTVSDTVSAATSTCTATGAKTSVNHDYTAESSYNYYLNIGKAIESDNYLPAGEHMNNATWLSEMLNSAYILLSKMDSDNNIYNVNVATDTSLQEVSDETLLKKAEAKYEADMRKINQKDKKFDTELAAMDAERNAVKTEMDTLKSVAKENVDRTFKLFG